MSFLLDSDVCSAYLRQPGPLFARFMQSGGRLWISTIALSDLYHLGVQAGSSDDHPGQSAGFSFSTFSFSHLTSNARSNSASCEGLYYAGEFPSAQWT
jgi:hypothetical protein